MDRNYYVYQHVTPDGMYYFGVTKNPNQRWRTGQYNKCSFRPYIEKYGWDNIQHNILMRELTYEEAVKTENMLIKTGREDGVCINKIGSGLISKNRKEYRLNYNENHKEDLKKYRKIYNHGDKHKDYIKKYREEHREELKEKRHLYYENNKERTKLLEKKYREEHKEQERERHRRYENEHREERNEKRRKRYAEKKLLKQIQPDGCISLF